jgi:hypothetical protein
MAGVWSRPKTRWPSFHALGNSASAFMAGTALCSRASIVQRPLLSAVAFFRAWAADRSTTPSRRGPPTTRRISPNPAPCCLAAGLPSSQVPQNQPALRTGRTGMLVKAEQNRTELHKIVVRQWSPLALEDFANRTAKFLDLERFFDELIAGAINKVAEASLAGCLSSDKQELVGEIWVLTGDFMI